jgi:hypothetical protein
MAKKTEDWAKSPVTLASEADQGRTELLTLALALADEALRLINSQPKTPGRQELAAVLEVLLADLRQEAQPCCGKWENCTRACYHRGYQSALSAIGKPRPGLFQQSWPVAAEEPAEV